MKINSIFLKIKCTYLFNPYGDLCQKRIICQKKLMIVTNFGILQTGKTLLCLKLSFVDFVKSY